MGAGLGGGLGGGCRAMVDGKTHRLGVDTPHEGEKYTQTTLRRRLYRCFSFYRYDTSKTKSHLEAFFRIVSPPRHFRLATVKPKPVYTLHPAPSNFSDLERAAQNTDLGPRLRHTLLSPRVNLAPEFVHIEPASRVRYPI